MSTLVAYKAALAVLLAITGASSGGIAYYFQQKTSDLDSQVATLNSQNDALSSQITQLQNQISELQSRLEDKRLSRTIASGSVYVPYQGVSYISLAIDSLPSTLNVSFTITDFNPYYPQSVALHLLTQAQYQLFQGGDYTSTTWSMPYSTSLAATDVSVQSTGVWYLAFQEQNPGGGFPATVSYTVKLVTKP